MEVGITAPKRNKSSRKKATRVTRSLRVREDRRPEPDLEKIARVISDMIIRLSDAEITLEESHERSKKHRRILAALRGHGRDDPKTPLPGCECLICIQRRRLEDVDVLRNP